MFSITVLWFGISAGVNVPVTFLANGIKVYPSLRGTNMVTRYGLPEGYCVISNKAAYMEDDIWEQVVKVVAPSIRKIAVRNVDYFVLFYYLSI